MDKETQSWGRITKASHRQIPIFWQHEAEKMIAERSDQTVLAYGSGRSYGDSCLNDQGCLLMTRPLDRILEFDRESGIIDCEAGVSFETLLDLIVPAGWFLSVTPGTQYVTVGGAVANDVHGKNHHKMGTFGCHVEEIELVRSSGERIICSLNQNQGYFAATIGGLGLTGLILRVRFKLIRIETSYMNIETIKFSNLQEYIEIFEDCDQKYPYTVAWIDSIAGGDKCGRGHLICGQHALKSSHQSLSVSKNVSLTLPFELPSFLLNKLSVGAFNSLYYHRQRAKSSKSSVHYMPFFYPLDKVLMWNRLYGKNGFYQFQCTVPKSDPGALSRILKLINDSGLGSFLAVLKTFGEAKSPGILSYPSPGFTLAIDLANKLQKTDKLFEKLHEIVLDVGGRVYPAKDAKMMPEIFHQSFPNLEEFIKYKDPNFSSSFWRRVTDKN